MAVIQSENKVHAGTCIDSEMNRQGAIAAAYAAGGGSAAVAAAIKTAEIAHYRRIIASCKANSLPFNNFTVALLDLGTGGS
ncbi:hypothetical protein Bra1253DRAFT_00694 [Bradyrhizobium sp. WSM1253]|nr:hypothetical protein Bra1253DRAFT_00694 [Bradyrhizobium sp. WSM1253]